MQHRLSSELFDNILPYLGIEENYTEAEVEKYKVGSLKMPDFIGKNQERSQGYDEAV